MGWVVKYQNCLSSKIRTDGIFVKKDTAELWEICVSLCPTTVQSWIEEVSVEKQSD
ncbi:hypothetical protein SAMD00079811_83170 (plasmid) [Scytonema sp. HK-05]|nr:hypothetical protein SAMD00079811_83170 [Scytonema sp. HK-05]